MSIDVIFRRSILEGPSFARWLDGYRSYILGLYAGRKYFSYEYYESYEKVSYETKENYIDVSGLYRPNALYPWKPEVPLLRDICFDEVIQEQGALDVFRDTLKRYLERIHPNIRSYKETAWTSLLQTNDRSTFNGKSMYQSDAYPAFERGISRIVTINRELKAARVACVEEYDSILRVRWIDKCVSNLLQYDRRDCSRNEAITIKRSLEKAIGSSRQPNWSYCRDFNKEGLTKPRNILRILLEELHSFTGWECFSAVGFFDQWRYLEGEDIVSPPRGHGLGMANALTTLMSIVIEEMTYERYGTMPNWSGYNNDDAIMIFESKRACYEYATHDRAICESLGLDFKPKASYIAEGEASFCEQYANVRNRTYGWKGSYYTMAFFNLLKCVNASHARFIASSQDTKYVPKQYLDIVLEYWGWSIYRNEHARPSIFGGWFNRRTGLCDSTFYDEDADKVVPREEVAGYLSYKEVQYRTFPWMNDSINNKMFKHFDAGALTIMGVPESFREGELLRPSRNKLETVRSWRVYQEKLRAAFSKHQREGPIMTFRELYKECAANAPHVDFLPPKGEEEMVIGEETSTTDKSFYSPYMKFDLETNVLVAKSIGSSYPWKRNENQISLSLNKGKKGYRGAAERARELGYSREWESYIYPPEVALEYYCNPFNVIRVCDEMGSNYHIALPKTKIKEKMEFLKSRDQIYMGALPIQRWVQIGSLRPSEIALLQRLWPKVAESETDKNNFIKVLQKYPRIGLTMFWEGKPLQNIKRFAAQYSIIEKPDDRSENIKRNPPDIVVMPWDFESYEAHKEGRVLESDNGFLLAPPPIEGLSGFELEQYLAMEAEEAENQFDADDCDFWEEIADQFGEEDVCQPYEKQTVLEEEYEYVPPDNDDIVVDYEDQFNDLDAFSGEADEGDVVILEEYEIEDYDPDGYLAEEYIEYSDEEF